MQKILIVDDQQSNIDYMRRYLSQFVECDIYPFTDPQEALDFTLHHLFDIALVDYRMPGLSGLDFVREVRKNPLHEKVPLILITADDNKELISEAFDLGVSDYLSKPFTRGEFSARIRNLLDLRASTLQLEADKHTLEVRVQEATIALQESDARFRLALDATKDGIWDWDLVQDRLFYSENWCAMLGYAPEEVPPVFAFWMGRVHPEDAHILMQAVDHHAMGMDNSIECEYRMFHRKGHEIWVRMKGKAVRDNASHVIRLVGAQSDITPLKEFEKQLTHSALHDTLTGLPNRSLFNERLNQAYLRLKRAPSDQFALLFVDLDHFKEINDTYGHGAGDRILKEVTRILKTCTREVDTVARLGGDEFVILLEKVGTQEETQQYIERLYQAIQKPVHLAGSDVKIGLSLGVAIADRHHSSCEQILKEADIALYEAKEKGRNRAVFYDGKLDHLSPRRQELTLSLGSALVKDEIEIYYQPIVDLKTQSHLGYEALLRWHHPTLGLISPEDFIPLAEKDDMIVRLGTYVVKGAVAQLSRWQKKYKNPSMFMCINVTAQQVFEKDFFTLLQQVCFEAQIAPDNIVLEFSEFAFAEIYKWDSFALSEIKKAGFHIALDDYGEGRASIRSLVDYQMDFLKIDRSLALELHGDERKRKLFDLMVHLGAEGGLQIVVEGIQTQKILEYVGQSKAQMGQGYLFAKPCRVSDIEGMLKKRA